MKNLLKATAFAAVATFGLAQGAAASLFRFEAILSPLNEVPPTASTATGLAYIAIDDVANTMRVQVAFSGLTTGVTASHIHCCLLSPFATGVNAGVATTTPTFTGFPSGVTSGFYDHTFDMTLASSYNPSFVSSPTGGNGSVTTAEAVLFAGIKAGESYLNIHTTMFGGGEIRGFLVATPEPATLAVFGAGLAGLVGAARRRRKEA